MQMWTGYIVSPLTEKKKMFIEVEREMAKYDIIAGKIADDALLHLWLVVSQTQM